MALSNAPDDERGRQRLAEIRAEICERLRGVTSEMSDEPRNALLDHMALVQWRAEYRELPQRERSGRSHVMQEGELDPGKEPRGRE